MRFPPGPLPRSYCSEVARHRRDSLLPLPRPRSLGREARAVRYLQLIDPRVGRTREGESLLTSPYVPIITGDLPTSGWPAEILGQASVCRGGRTVP